MASDIGLPPCECDERGHIIGASGMCQWCHRLRKDLEHEWMQDEITSLRQRLAEAKAERDEAMEAARWLFDCDCELHEQQYAMKRWPWLTTPPPGTPEQGGS